MSEGSETGERDAEGMHVFDAYSVFYITLTLICSVLLSYYIKNNKIYFLPESAATMLLGVGFGFIASLCVDDLELFSFNPELFFFIYLPPIIFEAGYGLDQKRFFDNIGAIFMYAMIGTLISTFIIAYLTLVAGRMGLITSIDTENPMETLLFGALISAVDPVATLSIMGSPELECDPTLYTLVFGESVLNDAIAMVLFRTFRKYYNPETPSFSSSDFPEALLEFGTVSVLSIVLGSFLGLVCSFIYKHSQIEKFPQYEAALLLLICYCCYAVAEALDLSGIMALFFNGIVLSHYNSHNLNKAAHEASEQIFGTLAVVMESAVFLYMGMAVFTHKYADWDPIFSALAIGFCLFARALNIFPLSYLANQCRRYGENYIPMQMQGVLWFAGLRGAVAFALVENMPGPNKDTYASVTLTIVFFTTFISGGFTEKALSMAGMKKGNEMTPMKTDMGDKVHHNLITRSDSVRNIKETIYTGFRGVWTNIDNKYLIPYFGGSMYEEISNGEENENNGTLA